MTIIIDLDHTLLNTTLLKVTMARAVSAFGVSQQMFDSTYSQTVERDQEKYSYESQFHAKLLAQALGKPELEREIFNKLNDAISDTPNLVYDDAIPFLQQAKQAQASILLLTRGDPVWQQAKINAARLRPLVDRVVIAPESKGEILRGQIRFDESTFFVTDNDSEISALEGIKLQIIQLIRPEGKYQKEAQGVPVARTLQEVWNIISQKAGLEE